MLNGIIIITQFVIDAFPWIKISLLDLCQIKHCFSCLFFLLGLLGLLRSILCWTYSPEKPAEYNFLFVIFHVYTTQRHRNALGVFRVTAFTLHHNVRIQFLND